MSDSQKHSSPEKYQKVYRSMFDAVPDGLIIADLETGLVMEANPAISAMHGFPREEFIGALPAVFIHPASQEKFRTYLQEFRSSPLVESRLVHLRRDGSSFHAEWRGTTFTYQGKQCLLGVVRDVSRRIQAEQRLQHRVEVRTREQSTLLEISHALASTLELQPGLILKQLLGIVKYTHAGLFGLTGSTLTVLAVHGSKQVEQAALSQIHLRDPETLVSLFNGHQPIRIADVYSGDPEAVLLRTILKEETAVFLKGVRAWMWVPLAVKGRIIGGLGLAHARRNYFSPHHAALALSMADQAAITMVNTELYEHARTLAALQERQRLAQNLHDAVNQSLFSAGLIAEVLPRLWEQEPLEARKSLEDLRRLIRGALAEMRELLAELRPTVLTDSNLGDLLRQLANAFTGRTSIPVSMNIVGELYLPSEVQVVYYRICQETLNNIAKHAEARQVKIDLAYDTHDICADLVHSSASVTQAGAFEQNIAKSAEMCIRDDGNGFDPAVLAAPGHYGLGMMRERAESVGAQLTITSRSRKGTEVTLCWPGTLKQELP